jgi:hypothetical protein
MFPKPKLNPHKTSTSSFWALPPLFKVWQSGYPLYLPINREDAAAIPSARNLPTSAHPQNCRNLYSNKRQYKTANNSHQLSNVESMSFIRLKNDGGGNV